jgi:hypothetical protein
MNLSEDASVQALAYVLNSMEEKDLLNGSVLKGQGFLSKVMN